PFHLLSDEGGKVRKQYGATAMPGVPGRVTDVIAKDGVVRHRWSAMFNADKHIEDALKIVKALNESYPQRVYAFLMRLFSAHP
ncbi:MAG: hypothetical protein ABIK28_15940, partial [Planctomycetota bacterium]